MLRASLDLLQKHGPPVLSHSTPQTQATTQVGAAGNSLAERFTGELGIPRRKAKLEVEIIFVGAAGHLRIIGRYAFDPQRASNTLHTHALGYARCLK